MSAPHEWNRADGGWRCLRCGALTGAKGTQKDAAPGLGRILHYEFHGDDEVIAEWLCCDELLVKKVMES